MSCVASPWPSVLGLKTLACWCWYAQQSGNSDTFINFCSRERHLQSKICRFFCKFFCFSVDLFSVDCSPSILQGKYVPPIHNSGLTCDCVQHQKPDSQPEIVTEISPGKISFWWISINILICATQLMLRGDRQRKANRQRKLEKQHKGKGHYQTYNILL